jgi:hypothetical protein
MEYENEATLTSKSCDIIGDTNLDLNKLNI